MERRSSRCFPRQPDLPADLSTDEGALRYAEFYTGLAANIVGACMIDNPGNTPMIDDLHDVIGALGAVQNTLQLLRERNTVAPSP